MKTYSKEERLEILNKYLGYGSPDATIYFIGLEEKSPWTIEELSKNYPDKDKIEVWLKNNPQMVIDQKIKCVKENFGFDFEEKVCEWLDKYKKNEPIFSTNESPGNYNGTRTDCKQSDLSLEILKTLKLVPKEEDKISYYDNKFATSLGFEACLNYFPVARSKTSLSYDEEKFLFGTSADNKFGDAKFDFEKMRKDYFKELFERINFRVNNKDDVFLIFLGEQVLNKVSGLLDCKLKTLGKGVAANNSRNIWSIYHPRYYGFWENKRILIQEIGNSHSTKR